MNLPGNYFITAWVPPDLQDWIRHEAMPRLPLYGSLPRGLYLEAPFRWHLTLRYLGGVSLAAMPCIEQALAGLASRTFPVSLNFDMIGCFQKGRIAWLGPREPVPALAECVAQLNENLSKCGFKLENRSFRPHITLVRSPQAWPCQRVNLPSVRWSIDQFHLVRSLHGQYRSEASWTFRNNPNEE